MSLTEELKGLGVNVDEGLERVMGDHSLYEMMLEMFVDTVRDNPVSLMDFESSDLEPLIKQVHMLKGVTGNLAMTSLFTSYTEVLGLLRSGKATEGRGMFEHTISVQKEIIDCIKKYKNA